MTTYAAAESRNLARSTEPSNVIPLPFRSGSGQTPATVRKSEPATVFLVDHDPSIQRSLAWMFQVSGLHVVSYMSVKDLLECLEPDAPGCVVIGLSNTCDGLILLLSELAQRRSSMSVILVSDFGSPVSVVRPVASTSSEGSEEPFDLAILNRVTRSVELSSAIEACRRRAGAARARLDGLTPRERQIAELVSVGHPNKVIAFDLAISERTVECHRARIMRKTGSESLADLVKLYVRANEDCEALAHVRADGPTSTISGS